MKKLIFIILIATITIFAQKTANWLFLGKSTDRTSVYMDINSVKQSGNSVQFIGKMETLTGFKANCKTFEFIAYGTGGAVSDPKVATKDSYIYDAIEQACGQEQ